MKQNILYFLMVANCVIFLMLSIYSFKDYNFNAALAWFIALAGAVGFWTLVITKYVRL